MSINVRFAPSPTGVLHIGSVRTALFNWLFARHMGGQFFLRIEDTDKLRSTEGNTASILHILQWLGIDWDGEPVIQSARISRHIEVANDMVARGVAYRCYCEQADLAKKKEESMKSGKSYQYDRLCRDIEGNVEGKNFVVRLKADILGATEIHDMVLGKVSVNNSEVDDLVLLRSDGTPTYMLSVVVDDHDMNITHVIRGDDHLTNAFRQIQIYQACGWEIPKFAHMPLIYGADGAKLSKRHGAASTQDYIDKGYLSEAILNYLLRLGWSHGNDEIISMEEAISWFDFDAVGKSPSRFDMLKLENLNAHYIRKKPNTELADLILPTINSKISDEVRAMIVAGMDNLKTRAKTLNELAVSAMCYVSAPDVFEDCCMKYATELHCQLLEYVSEIISLSEYMNEDILCDKTKLLAKEQGVKLVEIAQALRAALCGKLTSPSVFEIVSIIGKKESVARIETFLKYCKK